MPKQDLISRIGLSLTASMAREAKIGKLRGGEGWLVIICIPWKSKSLSYYSASNYAEARFDFEDRTKSYSFNGSGGENREVKRRRRVAGYNMYSMEGKVKTSLRNSFKWLKIIVDELPPSTAPVRSRRGGRLRSLGSLSVCGYTSQPNIITPSSSRTRASSTHRSSVKNRESSEPLREPTVDEIIPAEFSFSTDRESIRNQVTSMTSHDRADVYPSQIIDGLISLVRRECYWKPDFPILVPVPNQRITSFLVGYSLCQEQKGFATMEVFDEIPDFRAWVEKLLSVAPMERRSWKYLSYRFGWKVKTHGFSIRGASATSITSSRLSLSFAQEMILNSSAKRKTKRAHDSEGEEEQDEDSLVRRPRARRRIIPDDEATPPPSSVPMNEPESVILTSSDEEMNSAPHVSTDQLFSLFAPVVAATTPPVAVFTSSTVPTATILVQVFSSSWNRMMKKFTIEVPENGNLSKKFGQADVWLKPLIGPVEKSKLKSHSSLTWINDIVHSYLKINLIGTELMKRIVNTEQLVNDYHTKADNWREQYDSLQLQKQSRSKATEEIRRLKEMLNKKEIYAGELVQILTLAQENLRVSSDKVQFLERSFTFLKAAYDASSAEREELEAEIEQWEKDYKALEDKSTLDEGFDLTAEIAKAKETIEKTRQRQNFSSPEVGIPEGDELTLGEVDVQASSAQVVSSPIADDALLDSTSLAADSTTLDPAL
uniref:Uncharacterized protein LOC104231901 n=1 Tax=Nicotiana sylvestris TaxID=4096 RepID=A0A1U7X0S1_NICSY|nr:PREDICTED: uncharacterized protein LOC104231901 [Nicotiana sylvestris]